MGWDGMGWDGTGQVRICHDTTVLGKIGQDRSDRTGQDKIRLDTSHFNRTGQDRTGLDRTSRIWDQVVNAQAGENGTGKET